jgi:hypothetical protein
MDGFRTSAGAARPAEKEFFFGPAARVCSAAAEKIYNYGYANLKGCMRIKNLRLCRFGAFENPQCTWAPHDRVSDPTARAGLRAPAVCWLPRIRLVTDTAEVL